MDPDSYFTIRSLAELGYRKEADGFRRFVERTSAGSADEIQVLFGVGGERHSVEYVLHRAEGYRNSRPVRIGNAAESQTQLDVYGNLLGLAWIWHTQGQSPDDDYWEFLVHLVNRAARRWSDPDKGMWEMQGASTPFRSFEGHVLVGPGPRHTVGRRTRKGIRRLEDWKNTRDRIRLAIQEQGYDRDRGVSSAFGHPEIDAQLAAAAHTGFVDCRDEGMIRTADAVQGELEKDGLLRRYACGSDGMVGTEGVFCCCSFWLAECLAYQGRLDRALKIFQRARGAGNDLEFIRKNTTRRQEKCSAIFPRLSPISP